MADELHAYIEERLRITLTGSISGQQMDSFIPNLTHLFKTVRPSAKPKDIFIAVSEPSVCDAQYCCCKASDCRLGRYKIAIFISRREQGRLVTKPWVRASSTEGFEDAVASLMEQADELVEKAVEGSSGQAKVVRDSGKFLPTFSSPLAQGQIAKLSPFAFCLEVSFQTESGHRRIIACGSEAYDRKPRREDLDDFRNNH
ncbi:hypothetical protein K458DRAFT_456923 [Lentithecium fluviatile CBS 122367]|uniref:Uncharacterized protein n=1 Tax=Lentithecium fluviatile CBS 122367 TaxID=1168545 RepID=A0A6G1IUG5_9PLEO|nr:hypothetical protein K458DRAFT_456923 [Lentithecium fluviatile CBS 122367]